MADLTRTPLQSPAKKAPAVNPFAQALAEAEREKQYSGSSTPSSDSTNLFRDALAKTGGNFGDFNNPMGDQFDFQEQQRLMEEQRKKEMMRRKLHDQINPIDTIDVFNAREKKVKEEIDKLRAELKGLAHDVAKFQKDVEVTLMTEVSNPGLDGKYYITFFQQLRSFIMLLRQKIKSASTWATQLHGKKKKKQGKFGAGMIIGGAAHEKTSSVQDMMHHERSSQYSGG